MQKEKVLCIHKPDLPASWRRKTSIIPVDIDTFITLEIISKSFFDILRNHQMFWFFNRF
jgi:hypothetical protein